MKYWVETFARNTDAEGNKVLSSGDKSLIVSILSVGTFFGALASAQTADLLGRKFGLMVSTVVFTVSYILNTAELTLYANEELQVGVILQTASTSIPLLVVGRLIAGMGVGLLRYV